MIRRFIAAVALTVLGACFAPGAVQAQYPPAQYSPAQFSPAQPSPYGQPVYSPASFGGQEHGHDHSGGHSSCPVCMMSMSGAQGGGWPTPITAHYDQPSPFYRESYDDLSGDDGWDYGSSPFDAFLIGAVKGAYLRLEYLNWSYKTPGNQALGSALAGIPEPREPFPVTVASQLAGIARVATIDTVDLDHRNGIRGTIGMPLPAGRGGLEASIFWMQDVTERTQEFEVAGNEIGAPLAGTNDVARFIVTSTLTNGLGGSNLFIYDQSFGTRFSSDLWGAEFNWVSDPYSSGPGLQIRPLFGFRYLDIAEQLVQTGSFNQQGVLATPLVSVVTSRSDNAVYVPQVGLRMEFVHPRFALGIEPKIGFGINEAENTVVTERLRSQADPTITSTDQASKLSTVGEISLYGKLIVTENMTVNFGYSFLFVDNTSRAHNSIFYNDNGPQADAGIIARQSTELMYYQGLNLGAEYRY